MSDWSTPTGLYGVMAEFSDAGALVHATKAAYAAGYRKMDTYTPYPVEECAEAIGFHHNRVALVVLLGALAGMCGGYGLAYWVSAITYPINVGGRPFHSWPSFIPVTFESAILLGSICGVIGMLAMNKLPQPYHPVFNSPNFSRASRDRFFLCIESEDPKFRADEVKRFLQGFNPEEITEVPH